MSPLLIDQSSNWTCGQKVSHSDHELIQFDVRIPYKKTVLEIRTFKDCDWTTFKKLITENIKTMPIPKTFTAQSLNIYSNWFQFTIMDILNDILPKEKVFKDTSFQWWTDELQVIRKDVRKLRHRVQRTNSSCDWDAYKSKLKEYKYLLSKTKREFWKDFTSKSDKMTLQYKLNKIIFAENKTTLGALISRDGMTTTVTESLEVLLETHFLELIPHHQPDLTEPSSSQTNNITVDTTKSHPINEWITPTLVQKAIAGFQPQKTPGPDEMAPIMLKNLPIEAINLLTTLFKASILTCHIPLTWSKAKVIFILKISRSDSFIHVFYSFF